MVADHGVTLGAGNNVDILAATNTDTSWRFKETKKSGLMGTGGIGVTIGSSRSTHDRREAGTTQSQSAGSIGSTTGNVSITAGNQAHISGSDVIASRDISFTGNGVIIDPGHDKRTVDETFEQKKSGLTVALSGIVGSAINNAVTSAQTTKETSDSRLRPLKRLCRPGRRQRSLPQPVTRMRWASVCRSPPRNRNHNSMQRVIRYPAVR